MVLTKAGSVLGPVATVLGYIMDILFQFTGQFGILNVGLCIILFTIVMKTLMIPLTVKQQKSTKLMSIMSPELQAIQKKYRNKKDQASMMKQQEEIQQVYDKYGTSMMGGCLPMLVQVPLLLALYPVIYDIQTYVPAIKDAPASVNRFLTIPDLTIAPITMIKNSGDYGIAPALVIITAVLLPVLSGLTQYLSVKISQAISGQQMDKDNPMASTMNTMNVTMPLFSVFMVFSLPTGIGLYWVISAVVRIIQQVIINKSLRKISIEDLIERNKEKAEKKRQKRGEKAERINAMAQANTRSIRDTAKSSTSGMSEKEKEKKIEQARKSAENAKPGSLASKANMVKKFNENN